VLYSQPIVPLGDGKAKRELLLRMNRASGNVILPGSFLPVAEKYGLIGEIDPGSSPRRSGSQPRDAGWK